MTKKDLIQVQITHQPLKCHSETFFEDAISAICMACVGIASIAANGQDCFQGFGFFQDLKAKSMLKVNVKQYVTVIRIYIMDFNSQH